MNSSAWFYTLSGALFLGFGVVGLLFFRFWKKTRDRLFAIFACAFWVLMIERLILLLVDPTAEFRPFIYLVRLFAFVLILIAIVDKNRTQKRGGY